MEKITIAFGENADGIFWQGHFGDADYFSSYEISSDGKTEFVKKIKNSKKSDDETHGAENKLIGVKELLKGCDCAVASILSPNFKKMAENSNVQPLIIKGCSDNHSLLQKIAENFSLISEKVQSRKNGLRDAVIPLI
jgi:predicted Fe-Mo cluster-binding NifX family protein